MIGWQGVFTRPTLLALCLWVGLGLCGNCASESNQVRRDLGHLFWFSPGPSCPQQLAEQRAPICPPGGPRNLLYVGLIVPSNNADDMCGHAGNPARAHTMALDAYLTRNGGSTGSKGSPDQTHWNAAQCALQFTRSQRVYHCAPSKKACACLFVLEFKSAEQMHGTLRACLKRHPARPVTQ